MSSGAIHCQLGRHVALGGMGPYGHASIGTGAPKPLSPHMARHPPRPYRVLSCALLQIPWRRECAAIRESGQETTERRRRSHILLEVTHQQRVAAFADVRPAFRCYSPFSFIYDNLRLAAQSLGSRVRLQNRANAVQIEGFLRHS
jgi:hypothetical protein